MAVHQLDAPAYVSRSRVLGLNVGIVLPRIALATIAAVAALLRFQSLGSMPLNPYYDAAVRSMGSSWHAFFAGAFNPNASVAIDKPPLDLWLQVATTKIFGFTHFGLLLPEAFASTVAVVLLYDVVRRPFGRTAGLAAAAALAVLPVDVLTGRSDTMDGVMMALLVLAAWLVVRAVEKGRPLELYAAGAVAGLAFETKLFEALVAVPGLAIMFLAGSTAPWRRRLGQLSLAGAAMVAVGLAWTVAFALTPAAHRPYPMGSTSGSIWDTIFVYNGIGRLTSQSTLTHADRLNPPGVTRLLSGGPVQLNLLIGEVLFAAVAFGVAAALLRLARRRDVHSDRLRVGLALGMATWLVVGVAVLSAMRHMPLRYVEPLVPAVAAVLGIGVAYLTAATAGAAGRGRSALITAAVLLAAALGATLVYEQSVRPLPAGALIGAAGAAVGLPAAWVLFRSRAPRAWTASISALVAAFVMLSVLATPVSESIALVRAAVSDGGALGRMPPASVSALSSYLTTHRGSSRYEFAALDAQTAAALIVADAQPVLILAGTPYHPLVSARGLSRAVRAGRVRFVLLSRVPANQPSRPFRPRTQRGRIPAWVIRHGVDVTQQAGLRGYGMLYRVSAAR
jgi:4-amino-4-deoxy-L-arabinose transferase-like glycosyltransferase